MDEAPDQRMMNVREVAQLLRVSKMTVYRLCERGELGSVRVGRSIRIPRAAVGRYVRGIR